MKQRDERGRFVRTKPDYKALYEKERDKYTPIYHAMDKLSSDLVNTEDERDFLLDHCPFWVRWMYRKKFEKGN